MTTKKLLVEVELIPAMVSVIAEPGDKLMILNGLCIGVDTSREAPAPRRALPLPVQKPKQKRAFHTTGRARNPDSYTEQAREAIRHALADGKPHSRHELLAMLRSKPIKASGYFAISSLVRSKEMIETSPGIYTAPKVAAPKPATYHDNRLILYREMKALGITQSRHELEELQAAGEFPRSVKVGSGMRWRRHEVEAWLLNHQAA